MAKNRPTLPSVDDETANLTSAAVTHSPQKPAVLSRPIAPVAPVAKAAAAETAASETPPNGTIETTKPADQAAGELLRGTIEVPLAGVAAGAYAARHIEVNLNYEEAKLFKSVLNGLVAAGERLKDRTPVRSAASVLRWMLQNLQAGQ
jgi:hypothetical protein